MEVPQFFEEEPVPDQEQKQQQQEDEALQNVPVDPNQEHVEPPQFFDEGPASNLEQQEDEEARVLPVAFELQVQERIVNPEEVQQEYESPVAGNQLIEANIQSELVNKADKKHSTFLQNINTVHMAHELRQLREGSRNILQQIMANSNDHLRFRIDNITGVLNITQQEFSVNRRINTAQLECTTELSRMQLRTPRHLSLRITNISRLELETPDVFLSIGGLQCCLALESPFDGMPRFFTQDGLPRLSILECAPLGCLSLLIDLDVRLHSHIFGNGPFLPPRLLALEGPPRLLALEGPPRLLALEGPTRLQVLPLISVLECLPSLEVRPLLPSRKHPPRLLSLEGPPRSFTLDGQPRMSVLECPSLLQALIVRHFLPPPDIPFLLQTLNGRSFLSRVLALDDPPRLPDLECPSLLLALDNQPLSLASFTEEIEERSNLQEKNDLVTQGPSAHVPALPCEQAISPSKTKEQNAIKRQRRVDIFDSGQSDSIVSEALQGDYEKQDVLDPRVPEFSDPRELLKDLDFIKMKTASLEMGHIRVLEMQPIKDQELEPEGDQELEKRIHVLPLEVQRPNEEIIEIPEEPDEVEPNAEVPNNGGDLPFLQNERRRDGEADMEAEERPLNEKYPKGLKAFIAILFSGLLFCILIGYILSELPRAFGWRGNQKQKATTLVTGMVSNVTTPLTTNVTSSDYAATTSISNVTTPLTTTNGTSSDYDETTSIGDLSFNDTDMDI